jgi:hypothetical protein
MMHSLLRWLKSIVVLNLVHSERTFFRIEYAKVFGVSCRGD